MGRLTRWVRLKQEMGEELAGCRSCCIFATYGKCRPPGRFKVLLMLEFPLLPRSRVGYNLCSALFLGGGLVASHSRMEELWT